MATTSPAHMNASGGTGSAFASRGARGRGPRQPQRREARGERGGSRALQRWRSCTFGDSVNLEDEMVKVAANQMDYQAAASLYSRSLSLLKTAIGKR